MYKCALAITHRLHGKGENIGTSAGLQTVQDSAISTASTASEEILSSLSPLPSCGVTPILSKVGYVACRQKHHFPPPPPCSSRMTQPQETLSEIVAHLRDEECALQSPSLVNKRLKEERRRDLFQSTLKAKRNSCAGTMQYLRERADRQDMYAYWKLVCQSGSGHPNHPNYKMTWLVSTHSPK